MDKNNVNDIAKLNPISKEEFVYLFNRASDDVKNLVENFLANSQ